MLPVVLCGSDGRLAVLAGVRLFRIMRTDGRAWASLGIRASGRPSTHRIDRLIVIAEALPPVRNWLEGPDFRFARIGLFVYAIPSIIVVILETHFESPTRPILAFLLVAAFLGLILYVTSAYDSDYDTLPKPSLPDDIESKDREAILTDYQELGEEFRQKDMLMTRSIYLSLAISGVLVSILVRDTVWRPFIAMAGSVIAFMFVVSINSQMSSRAQLRDRREEIENNVNFIDRLSVVKSARIREPRPKFTNFSASRLILLAHKSTVSLWIGLYFYLICTF